MLYKTFGMDFVDEMRKLQTVVVIVNSVVFAISFEMRNLDFRSMMHADDGECRGGSDSRVVIPRRNHFGLFRRRLRTTQFQHTILLVPAAQLHEPASSSQR